MLRIDPTEANTPGESLRVEFLGLSIVYDYDHEPEDIGMHASLESDRLNSISPKPAPG